MSRDYMVLIVPEPTEETIDIEDLPARVFMRFTEPPPDEFLQRLSAANPGHRVYCLLGASSWHSTP